MSIVVVADLGAVASASAVAAAAVLLGHDATPFVADASVAVGAASGAAGHLRHPSAVAAAAAAAAPSALLAMQNSTVAYS